MLKYRARLTDPGDLKQERPVEVFGNSLSELEAWASKVLTASVSDDAAVIVYQTVEQQIKLIPKPKAAEVSA